MARGIRKVLVQPWYRYPNERLTADFLPAAAVTYVAARHRRAARVTATRLGSISAYLDARNLDAGPGIGAQARGMSLPVGRYSTRSTRPSNAR